MAPDTVCRLKYRMLWSYKKAKPSSERANRGSPGQQVATAGLASSLPTLKALATQDRRAVARGRADRAVAREVAVAVCWAEGMGLVPVTGLRVILAAVPGMAAVNLVVCRALGVLRGGSNLVRGIRVLAPSWNW
jgi:hypothetical protein